MKHHTAISIEYNINDNMNKAQDVVNRKKTNGILLENKSKKGIRTATGAQGARCCNKCYMLLLLAGSSDDGRLTGSYSRVVSKGWFLLL